MNIEQVKDFCKSFSKVTERENGHPSNILSFFICEKKFAYFKTSDPEKWRFSFRVTPERFLELTDQPGLFNPKHAGLTSQNHSCPPYKSPK
jgi:hypothetical protein